LQEGNDVGTGFLFSRSGPGLRLALAALIAVALPAAQAHAAKGASAQCHGVVGFSPATSVLPDVNPTTSSPANAGMTMSFTNSTPAAALPGKNKTSAVSGSFYISVDQACQVAGASSPQTPCAYGGTFVGAIDSLGDMTLDYSDPAGTSTPVFGGCRQVFLEQPIEKNTGAAFIGTSLLTQTPTSTAKGATKPPTCGLTNTRLILSCTANNI
jgi:hypothetical protein